MWYFYRRPHQQLILCHNRSNCLRCLWGNHPKRNLIPKFCYHKLSQIHCSIESFFLSMAEYHLQKENLLRYCKQFRTGCTAYACTYITFKNFLFNKPLSTSVAVTVEPNIAETTDVRPVPAASSSIFPPLNWSGWASMKSASKSAPLHSWSPTRSTLLQVLCSKSNLSTGELGQLRMVNSVTGTKKELSVDFTKC